MSHFTDSLAAAVQEVGSPLLVGIDPRVGNLPESLLPADVGDTTAVAGAFLEFGKAVIDVASGQVAAVKPQAAFYEQYGPAGMQALAETIRFARERDLLVILDGKRNLE